MDNYIVPISYELWVIKTLIHFNKNLIFSLSLSRSVSLSISFVLTNDTNACALLKKLDYESRTKHIW